MKKLNFKLLIGFVVFITLFTNCKEKEEATVFSELVEVYAYGLSSTNNVKCAFTNSSSSIQDNASYSFETHGAELSKTFPLNSAGYLQLSFSKANFDSLRVSVYKTFNDQKILLRRYSESSNNFEGNDSTIFILYLYPGQSNRDCDCY